MGKWMDKAISMADGEIPPKPKRAKLANSTLERAKQAATRHTEAIAEYLAERAAIQEYDGGLTRKQAETEARRTLRVFEYRLTDNPDSWLVLIAPGSDLIEAQKGLQDRFGSRLLDTRKHNHVR
jgi:hypothetical protein